MGWLRTILLGDIGNRLDIEDTEEDILMLQQDITRTAFKGMSQERQIEKLVSDNAELKLYLASIVRLLVVKGTISQDELEAIIKAIDAEDGTVDGKHEGTIV